MVGGVAIVDGALRAAMIPCSRAAPMSGRAPSSGGKTQINRPRGVDEHLHVQAVDLAFPGVVGPDPQFEGFAQ